MPRGKALCPFVCTYTEESRDCLNQKKKKRKNKEKQKKKQKGKKKKQVRKHAQKKADGSTRVFNLLLGVTGRNFQ